MKKAAYQLIINLAALLFLYMHSFAQDSKNESTNRKWWKEAIVYQIYPRSFKDSNGDGVVVV